jgi:hypothetical protein
MPAWERASPPAGYRPLSAMRVVRDYQGWAPDDPLDPEAESVLAFLDQLSTRGLLEQVGQVVARIDEYGVVYVDVPLGAASLYLQAGDGWDRVIWTTPSGRGYEWRWDLVRGPRQVSALVGGQGVERLTYLGRRRLASDLVADSETLASSGGLRQRLLRRWVVGLTQRDQSAL